MLVASISTVALLWEIHRDQFILKKPIILPSEQKENPKASTEEFIPKQFLSWTIKEDR